MWCPQELNQIPDLVGRQVARTPMPIPAVVASEYFAQCGGATIMEIGSGFPDVEQAGNVRTNARTDIDEARRTLA